MKIIKVPSKSTKGFRTVHVMKNTDGSTSFRCSCPAHSWWRISGGKHGKENCRHIEFAKKIMAK